MDPYFKINNLFYVCFIQEKHNAAFKHIPYYFDEATRLKFNFEKKTIYQKTINTIDIK